MNNVFIDTNIFIRLLTRDDETLYEKARKVYKSFEDGEAKGTVSILVVNEVLWVLENFYELEREVYIEALTKLLAFPTIDIMEIKKDTLMKILKYFGQTKFDFTDIYLRSVASAEDILSFDKDMQRIEFKG